MSAARPKHENATEREISKRNNMKLVWMSRGFWPGVVGAR
jgi:hypothetical protein